MTTSKRKEFICELSSAVFSWRSCRWQVCSAQPRSRWREITTPITIVTIITTIVTTTPAIITVTGTVTGEVRPIGDLIIPGAIGIVARTVMAITALIRIGIGGIAFMTRNSLAHEDGEIW